METTTANVATDVLRVDVPEQFIALFGIREENMRLFREELDVDIYAHGGEVTFTGDADKVALARLTLEKLLEIIQRGDPVDRTRIRYAIELASEGNADRIGEIMRDVIAITHRGRQVKCKTLGQKQYVDAIKQNTCTFAVGPAGTGKTYLAIAMAVVALKSKDVERIILTRPAVEAGEKLGFLRGPGAEGRSLSAPPLRRAARDDGSGGLSAAGGARSRGSRAACLHARPHAQRRLHHPR